MKTQRELAIDAYIQQHPDTELPAPHPVGFHGKVHQLAVYRLPIELLIFNIGNGRFAAELMAEEKKVGRKLDTTNREDAKIIRQLLLEQNTDETKVLTEDLKRNGQLEPGIITFDGAVVNANRRMAIFQLLHDDGGDEKFEYLNVARLPHGVDEKDLWKIEAKLQFGRDFRVEYGPVNELLKIRAGKHSGLSEKQISDALAGRYSPKDVTEKLEILKLIESYLRFIGKPGEYKIVQEERQVEKFNSLHSSVVSALKRGAHKAEIPKITEIAFAMIKGNRHSHWQIRKLRRVAELEQSRGTLYTIYDRHGKLTEDSGAISDAFDAAEFIVDAQEEKDRPEKLADKALSALRQIDSKHGSVKGPAFQKLIDDISVEVKRLSVGEAKKRDKGSYKS
jgi:hypothetical protein